jgi:hypothetical protein
VARHDADRESTAFIRMLVDEYDTAMLKTMETTDEKPEDDQLTKSTSDLVQELGADSVHWRLGSHSSRLTTAAQIQSNLSRAHPVFAQFSQRLRDFFASYYPEECLPNNLETTKVRVHFHLFT